MIKESAHIQNADEITSSKVNHTCPTYFSSLQYMHNVMLIVISEKLIDEIELWYLDKFIGA